MSAMLAFIAAAFAASVPHDVYFQASPSDVSAKLASFCMDRGITVVESDDHHVLCSKEMDGGKSILTQLLIGNAYSTPPVQNVRFQIVGYGSGSRVQFSEWVETQMPGGQVSRVPNDSSKEANNIRSLLYGIGATGVPARQ